MSTYDTTTPEFAAASAATAAQARGRHVRQDTEARRRTAARTRARADVERWAPRVRSALVARVDPGVAADGTRITEDGRQLVVLDMDGVEVEAEWLLLPAPGDRVRVLIDPGGFPLVLGTPRGTPLP